MYESYLLIISTDHISYLDIQLHDYGPGLVSWQGAGGHNVVDEVRDPDDGDREGVVHGLTANILYVYKQCKSR